MSALQEIMGTIAQNDLYNLIGDANGARRTCGRSDGRTHARFNPQRRGAKMLFFENGETAGTVGGGCVEAEVWAERARRCVTAFGFASLCIDRGRSERRGHGVRRHNGYLHRHLEIALQSLAKRGTSYARGFVDRYKSQHQHR